MTKFTLHTIDTWTKHGRQTQLINNIEVSKSVQLTIRDNKDSFVKVSLTHCYHDSKNNAVDVEFRRIDNVGELMWKFAGRFDVDQLCDLFTLKPYQQTKIYDVSQSGVSMYSYDIADKHGNNQHFVMLYDYYGEYSIRISRDDGSNIGDLLKIIKGYYYEFHRQHRK